MKPKLPSPKQIAATRQKLGLDHDEMARVLGTTGRTVRRWESEGVTACGILADALVNVVFAVEVLTIKRARQKAREALIAEASGGPITAVVVFLRGSK